MNKNFISAMQKSISNRFIKIPATLLLHYKGIALYTFVK